MLYEDNYKFYINFHVFCVKISFKSQYCGLDNCAFCSVKDVQECSSYCLDSAFNLDPDCACVYHLFQQPHL